MNYVAYIVYGKDEGYFLGAKFSILSLLTNNTDELKIVVLTDNENYFQGLPVITLPLTQDEKDNWSLNNRYHFRIKNRGLNKIITDLNLSDENKIIAIDTDTYFTQPIAPIFKAIDQENSTMFKNEGKIREKSRFNVYKDALDGKHFTTPNKATYTLSMDAEMWGALLLGFQISNKHLLDKADDLMLCLLGVVDAHTIEQFALSESIKSEHNLVESKAYVLNYSTSGKKRHALRIITKFFENYSQLTWIELAKKTKYLNLKRNLFSLLRSRYERYFSK